MTLVDGLVVLAIFGSFVFLILSKLNEKNPRRVQWIYDLFRTKKSNQNLKDKLQQIYPEKRRIM